MKNTDVGAAIPQLTNLPVLDHLRMPDSSLEFYEHDAAAGENANAVRDARLVR